jgi:predicted CoA-binding protein
MIEQRVVDEFLAQQRFAVVGASDDPKNFGRTICRDLRDRGYDVVAVHPAADQVDGLPAFPRLDDVPGTLDGVIVMVPAERSTDVVRGCIARGVRRVWLFRGAGGAGSVSAEAVELCRQHGIEVIAGACPLMFLEPVGWFHRVHRAARRMNGSLARAS